MTTTVSGATALRPSRERLVGPAYRTDDDLAAQRETGAWCVVQHAVARSGGDVFADVLSEAWRPGVAEPIAIHVRPEVQARLVTESRPPQPSGSGTGSPAWPGVPIPLVIDDRIPTAPGYEVHRVPPPPPDRADLRQRRSPSTVSGRVRSGPHSISAEPSPVPRTTTG